MVSSHVTLFCFPAKFDLKTICDALGSIEGKWYKIGIQLGIPHNKLQEFVKDVDPLSAVIDYWLKGNVTESVSPISWDTIVTALRSQYIGEHGLAEKINKAYCQLEGSAILHLSCSYVGSNDKGVRCVRRQHNSGKSN